MASALAFPALNNGSSVLARPPAERDTHLRSVYLWGQTQGSRASTALVYVCKANQNTPAYVVNSYSAVSLGRQTGEEILLELKPQNETSSASASI